MTCFVLSFGNLVLPTPSEAHRGAPHAEGEWKEHTEAEARHRYSHNSSDLFGIIPHGLALIAGRSFQHLNTILERRSDNHLVRIARLRLLIIASAADVRYMGGEEKQRAGHSCSIHTDFLQRLCSAPRKDWTGRYIVQNRGPYGPTTHLLNVVHLQSRVVHVTACGTIKSLLCTDWTSWRYERFKVTYKPRVQCLQSTGRKQSTFYSNASYSCKLTLAHFSLLCMLIPWMY